MMMMMMRRDVQSYAVLMPGDIESRVDSCDTQSLGGVQYVGMEVHILQSVLRKYSALGCWAWRFFRVWCAPLIPRLANITYKAPTGEHNQCILSRRTMMVEAMGVGCNG